MGYQFDEDTAVQRVGEHRFETAISGAWNIRENPNGGYLLSSLLRAMGEVSEHPDPLSVTTHFLRPGSPDRSADIEIEPIRSGRTVSNVRGRTVQDGRTRLEAMAVFTDLSASAQSELTIGIEPIDVPAPEHCVPRGQIAQGVELPILDRLDIRIHPDMAHLGSTAEAETAGWIRFADGRPPDAAALALFCDAFPPPLFTKLGRVGWVPTVELTVHVRRRPVAGWIRGHFATYDTVDNRTIEDGVLWDDTGQVVARSRQVALILEPPN